MRTLGTEDSSEQCLVSELGQQAFPPTPSRQATPSHPPHCPPLGSLWQLGKAGGVLIRPDQMAVRWGTQQPRACRLPVSASTRLLILCPSRPPCVSCGLLGGLLLGHHTHGVGCGGGGPAPQQKKWGTHLRDKVGE